MAETPRVAGVVPLVGLTASHAPPLLVVALAVKLVGVVLLTERLCEEGGDPPCWKPKAKVLGVTIMVAAAVMVSVTGTVTVPREDEMAIEPL